jgi:purine-binding chemotaxis protein CheW
LLIDRIGEVMRLDRESCESVPVNMDPQLTKVATGIHRLDDRLLIIADVDRALNIDGNAKAA